jgi:hypothetical protein
MPGISRRILDRQKVSPFLGCATIASVDQQAIHAQAALRLAHVTKLDLMRSNPKTPSQKLSIARLA